jgi:serine/threonine-protein kinase
MSEIRSLINERYYILEEIGRGGLTTVFKAFDFQERCDVALKILSSHLILDPVFKARFEREVKILEEFDHPHIVPILDSGEHHGSPFLVMPIFPGGTLADRLQIRPLSPDECGRLVNEISLALAYEHKRGIVHRDVKPSNILLDEEGRAYLSDFDLVYLPDTSQNLTGSAVIGTPAYMSPEQCNGSPVTQRSDQYSLAIVLFQLTTGHLPFYAETPIALAIQQINEPIPLPRDVNPNLPESIQKVLLRALSKDPEQRYPSILSFNHAFQKTLKLSLLADRKQGSWTAKYYDITQGFEKIHSGAKEWISTSVLPKRYTLLGAFFLLLAIPFIANRFLGLNPRSSEEQLRATIEAIYTDYSPQEGTSMQPSYVETIVAGTVSALEVGFWGTSTEGSPILLTGGDELDGTALWDEDDFSHLLTALATNTDSDNSTGSSTPINESFITPTVTSPTVVKPTKTPKLPRTQSPTSTPVPFVLPTDTPSKTSTSIPNKICDKEGRVLLYEDMHLHSPYVNEDGFGIVIHAIRIDGDETEVVLRKVIVTQDQVNPQILNLSYLEWSHWGMDTKSIPINEEDYEVTIDTNLELFECYRAGMCDHSLYGGDIYIHFDGTLKGDYQLSVEIYLPEYSETCKMDDWVTVTQ